MYIRMYMMYMHMHIYTYSLHMLSNSFVDVTLTHEHILKYVGLAGTTHDRVRLAIFTTIHMSLQSNVIAWK